MSADTRIFDEMDHRLLEHLREDGRASNRSLARALGINEVTVASRLRRMESEDMVRVVALTDFDAFGYTYLAFLLINVAGRPALDIAPEIAAIPEAISVTVATGRYDIIATVVARDRAGLAQMTGEVVPAIKGIASIRTELGVDIMRYDSEWSALRMVAPDPPAPIDTNGVDELDLAIIAELQKAARSSNRRIAAELDVSEGTVRGRLRRMEEERRIRIQAITDIEASGLTSHALVGVHVQGGAIKAVGAALLEIEGIMVVMRSLGEFDFFTVVAAHSREELIAAVLDEIQRIPNVRGTETFESAATLKHAFTWARIFPAD